MGIMSILAEMHGTSDFKLNLKFEIEVLCKQLEIQLTVGDVSRELNERPLGFRFVSRIFPFTTFFTTKSITRNWRNN